MRIDNVLTLHLTPRTDARDYYAIEERVAAIPGVAAAGFTQLVLFHVRDRNNHVERRQCPRPDYPVAVVLLFDYRSDYPLDTDAVAPHYYRYFLTFLVEHCRSHRLRVFRS